MIYILFDYSNQKNTPSFISKGLGLDKAKDVYSTLIWGGKKSSQWILGCLKAIRCSKGGGHFGLLVRLSGCNLLLFGKRVFDAQENHLHQPDAERQAHTA